MKGFKEEIIIAGFRQTSLPAVRFVFLMPAYWGFYILTKSLIFYTPCVIVFRDRK